MELNQSIDTVALFLLGRVDEQGRLNVEQTDSLDPYKRFILKNRTKQVDKSK